MSSTGSARQCWCGGGGEQTTVEMSSLTSTLDQVMAIWADVIRNPAFTDVDFKRLQAQQVQALRQAHARAQRHRAAG